MFVTGLVLAAGASSRLGQPKQLLALEGGTLLDATLSVARACRFDQLLVALGAASEQVRASVDLSNAEVVENPAYGSGCSSSISAGLRSVDDRADGLVLLLGDQPGIDPADVARLISDHEAPMALCRYDDGLGHPMWFRRALFPALSQLHGAKAVWRLLHSGRCDVREVMVKGPIPRDVDTAEDYEALLADHPSRTHR